MLQADDPLRSATRVDTVASYGQLRPTMNATDAGDADGMTSIDLDAASSSPGTARPGAEDPLAAQYSTSSRCSTHEAVHFTASCRTCIVSYAADAVCSRLGSRSAFV